MRFLIHQYLQIIVIFDDCCFHVPIIKTQFQDVVIFSWTTCIWYQTWHPMFVCPVKK